MHEWRNSFNYAVKIAFDRYLDYSLKMLTSENRTTEIRRRKGPGVHRIWCATWNLNLESYLVSIEMEIMCLFLQFIKPTSQRYTHIYLLVCLTHFFVLQLLQFLNHNLKNSGNVSWKCKCKKIWLLPENKLCRSFQRCWFLVHKVRLKVRFKAWKK